jgi:hypothetical protein
MSGTVYWFFCGKCLKDCGSLWPPYSIYSGYPEIQTPQQSQDVYCEGCIDGAVDFHREYSKGCNEIVFIWKKRNEF